MTKTSTNIKKHQTPWKNINTQNEKQKNVQLPSSPRDKPTVTVAQLVERKSMQAIKNDVVTPGSAKNGNEQAAAEILPSC